MRKSSDPLALENNADIDMKEPLQECDGETEPECLSSLSQCKYRVWECLTRWKYIICG